MSLAPGEILIAAAVALGGLAAIFRRRGARAMPAIRTFAVVAAAAIALLHLVPEAMEALGPPALLAALLGFAAPALLERMGQARAHEHAPTTTLALGYAAIVAHQAGEGALLASLARTGELTASIVIAIAAHTVPLAMVVAIRVLEVKGARATAIALIGVAAATVVGSAAVHLFGQDAFHSVEPWLLAVVAGLLLHALAHDFAGPSPSTRGERAGELIAALLGVAVALVGESHAGHSSAGAFAGRAVDVLLRASPVALVGLIAASGRAKPRPPPDGAESGALRQAMQGALTPLRDLPLGGAYLRGRALRVHAGRPAPFAVAAMISGSAAAIDGLLLTALLLGGWFALAHLAVSVMAGVAAGVAVAAAGRLPAGGAAPAHGELAPDPRSRESPPGALPRFLGSLGPSAPWLALGLAGAAYLEPAIARPLAESMRGPGGDMGVAFLLAVPATVASSAVSPVVAALAHSGLTPGAALIVLVLAPALGLRSLRGVRDAFGASAAALAGAGAAAACLLAALVANEAGLSIEPQRPPALPTLRAILAALLAALVAWDFWRSGLRGWFAEVTGTGPTAE